MRNTYHFISGLPRTGSSLLSAILSQNPAVYAGGNSALCQLMWDTQQSCRTSAYEQLAATGKFNSVQNTLCGGLPETYYGDISGKQVFDKCRSWTLPDNMNMVVDYITDTPKVVVLVRPIEEIVASFAKLNKDNGIDKVNFEAMLDDWSEPIMRSYNGVMFAKEANQGEFLFVDYGMLVSDTQHELNRIYSFIGLESFAHDFQQITVLNPEDDAVYGLKGTHDVRSKVEKRKVALALPVNIKAKCASLTQALYKGLDYGQTKEKAA